MARSERGMTLVEVMISAVVLSMVMLALSASLRTFATTYTAVETIAEHSARLREVSYLLRHAVREATFPYAGALEASASEIAWMAPLDRVGAAGGVMHLRLRKTGGDLVLDFAIPEDDDSDQREGEPQWGAVIKSETLLEGLDSFSVDVLPTAEEDWQSSFGEAVDGLPAAVRLTIEPEGMEWPPLVVALDGHRGAQ